MKHSKLTEAIWKILFLSLLVLALGGCNMFRKYIKPEPVNAQCGAACFVPCDTKIPLWQPKNPDAPNAWDSYVPQVTLPLAKKLDTCELARKTCEACLLDLKKAKVIK